MENVDTVKQHTRAHESLDVARLESASASDFKDEVVRLRQFQSKTWVNSKMKSLGVVTSYRH